MYFKKAIELDPEDWLGYINLGDAYRGKGDYDTAIEHYKKAIELNPEDGLGYISIGVTYGVLKREFERGTEYIKKAAQLGDEKAQRFMKSIDREW